MSRLAVMYPDPENWQACSDYEDAKEIAATEREAEIKAEAADYLDEAERGINHDYLLWDEEMNQHALMEIWEVLESKECPAEKVALCRHEIRKLMRNAADCHAECVANNRRSA